MRANFGVKMRGEELERDKWFRLEEREKASVRNVYKVGDVVKFSRTVERAGYWWQPEDMPKALCEELSVKLLALEATWNYRAYQTGEPEINQWNERGEHISIRVMPDGTVNYERLEFKERPEITVEMVNAVCEACDIFPERFWRHMWYRVRGKWCAQMRKEDKEHDCTLRTLYYQDNRQGGEWKTYHQDSERISQSIDIGPRIISGTIKRKITRLIGKYYPPTSDTGDYGDFYDPGGIKNAVHQSLLLVEEQYIGRLVVVHPLDVLKG